MKNAGLFVILIFRRKVFEKSTCFLLAGLSKNVGVNLGANLVQHSVKTYQFYKTIYDYTLTISHDMNVIRDIKHFQTVA